MILLDLLSCSDYRLNMEKCEDTAAPGSEVVFGAILNSRSMTEIFVEGRHLSIKDLKEHIKKDPTLWEKIRKLGRRDTNAIESETFPNKPKMLDYLHKVVPKYPTPVEFHVSHVAHVTEEGPFESILYKEKIRPSYSEYSWWFLHIDEEERTSAEERYLQENFTNRSQEQKPFLHHFTNSPAFMEESRYGSYRFKFLLADLMELYQEQLCGGEEPVLRVMQTVFYKKEIVYAVLIHSPQYNEEFADLPLLENNSEFVRYQDGKMVWRAQAISDNLEYELLVTDTGKAEVQPLSWRIFYVWDHVALAFHVPEEDKGLIVPRKRLIEALEACRISEINFFGNGDGAKALFEAAEKRVAELKEELENKMETENAIKHEPEEGKVVFDTTLNSRNIIEIFVEGKHLSIEHLKEHILEDPTLWDKVCGWNITDAIKSRRFPNKPRILDYLCAGIPKYPTPVEFHVSHVAHVTEEGPFESILYKEKIRPLNSEFCWWSLYTNEEERTSAEERYLQENFTNRSQEQKPFLHYFTNSPAFMEESRYGSYRFKFLLADLMELYQEQLCGGEEPVLRVMKTMFYKQEIVYAVLIHSPQYNEEFADLPLLENNSEFVCYQDGKMVWRAQAISDSLEYELLVTDTGKADVQPLFYPKYYVWDHVALAFHLPEKGKGLQVPRERLIEALEACRISERNLLWKCSDEDQAVKKRVAGLKNELEDKMETENMVKNEPEEDD